MVDSPRTAQKGLNKLQERIATLETAQEERLAAVDKTQRLMIDSLVRPLNPQCCHIDLTEEVAPGWSVCDGTE